MRPIRIVAFSSNFGLSEIIHKRLKSRGLAVAITHLEGVGLQACSLKFYWRLKSMLRGTGDEVTVFLPTEREYFFREPDLTLLYSAYRPWFDPSKFVVMPHLWAPNMPSEKDLRSLTWVRKPRLSIGFAGYSYRQSGAARLGAALPRRMKESFVDGRVVRHPLLVCFGNAIRVSPVYVPACVRIEALESLADSGLKQDVFLRDQAYQGKSDERSHYKQSMEGSTYVLCPRGIENFSFRFYEALGHGRVPVLIDSNQVLPDFGVDWDSLCVRVPYEQVDEIGRLVSEDYFGRTEADFLRRQATAFDTIRQLSKLDWIESICDVIEEKSQSKLKNLKSVAKGSVSDDASQDPIQVGSNKA